MIEGLEHRLIMIQDSLTIVICVDHASITGGQSQVAFESAIGLKARGHRPIVFAAAGSVCAKLRDAGIETVALDQQGLLENSSRLQAATRGIWNSPVARALDALLTRVSSNRTIVHVHGWAKALSPAIAGPIRRSGLPAIYTMHEYFQFCPNGGFYDYQQGATCSLTPLSFACWQRNCDSRSYSQKMWRHARLLVAKHVAHLPEVFSDYITISAFQAEIVAPLIPKAARLHRVSNPVAIDDHGMKPNPLKGDILFVGRLSPEKGILLFAEAARRIGMTPTFLGDGPLAAELAASYPEARLLGWKDPAGVQTAMRAARALVFPSLWHEGQPLTVLEAKALGLPIIVSDACAGREEVADGVTGLWFKSGDAADLSRALIALRDDFTVAAMSRAAHTAYWADPLTIDRHVGLLTTIYDEMIARAPLRSDVRQSDLRVAN